MGPAQSPRSYGSWKCCYNLKRAEQTRKYPQRLSPPYRSGLNSQLSVKDQTQSTLQGRLLNCESCPASRKHGVHRGNSNSSDQHLLAFTCMHPKYSFAAITKQHPDSL